MLAAADLWILGLAAILHFSTRVGPEIKVDFFDLLCACALSATGDKWSCTKYVLTGSIQRVFGSYYPKKKSTITHESITNLTRLHQVAKQVLVTKITGISFLT